MGLCQMQKLLYSKGDILFLIIYLQSRDIQHNRIKMFTSFLSDRELIPRIYQQVKKQTNKAQTQFILKWAKDLYNIQKNVISL